MTPPPQQQDRPSDKYLPLGIVAFFLVVFTVNGYMVYKAVSTSTGVVADQAYERGLHYNDYIARAEEQAARGWKSSLTYSNGELRATLTDREGKALDGAVVRVELMRPAQAGHDFVVELAPTPVGAYIGKVNFPLQGSWSATLVASWNTQDYRQTQTLFIRR